MASRILTCSCFLALAFCLGSTVKAVDESDLAQWVKQLDSDQFSERQAATKNLREAGAEAIPVIEKAAQGDSQEVTARSTEILKFHFEKSEGELKALAEKALERLGESPNPSVARRALEALRPKEPAVQPNAIGGGIVVNGAAIRIQVQAGAGNRRVQIRNVNGVKDIEAEENGQKIKIKDDPNKGIKIEVTEKKGDKEETKTYEAKNADDLKKNHPDAYKIYERYAQQQQRGVIQLRAFGRARALPAQAPQRAAQPLPALPNQALPNQALPNQALPNQALPNQALPIRARAIAPMDPVESAVKNLQEARKRLELKAEQGGDEVKKQLQPALESLQNAIDRLREAQKNLPEEE